jgi:cyanophycin synthetase
MKIQQIRTISGPNIYSYRPVLVMRLDLEGLACKETREINGFNERLIEMLPGLSEHHCSTGRPGGFTGRLVDGTYFGHVIEHVALELSELAAIPVFHGKTRQTPDPAIYNIIVEYKAEKGMKYLLKCSVELVSSILTRKAFDLNQSLREARRIIARTEPGPSTRSIIDAAEARTIPWVRIGDGSIVQLGYGVNRRLIQAAMTDRTNAISVDIASDKELTKILLEQASIPVPEGQIVNSESEATSALMDLTAPVVVKPLNGQQGKGVSLNLTTAQEVIEAFYIARGFSRDVLVEKLVQGRNYRVLVVNGRMCAASERFPAHVIGDGLHTIAELVEIMNQDPLRGEGHEKPLTKIKIDEIVIAYLDKYGLTPNYVPEQDQTIFLREGINLSTGGTAVDVTDIVHPTVKHMCERAARAIGLDVCGVDLVLKDITEPFTKTSGAVIEINASPGLRMHTHPSEGVSRDVGSAIVEMLYPQGAPSRVPVISITGTNGKTTVTRMIGRCLQDSGRVVGMTTTDGIYINDECILKGDTTGPASARTVLSDPTVEVAVLETARGGIVRRGLAYDWSDIGVITNIQLDHVGQDGITSVEDILYIKSLIAERVREGGTLILNADDEHLARLSENPRVSGVKRNIVYFSLREDHLLIRKHLDAGGTAYYLRNGSVVEARGAEKQSLFKVSDVPDTLNGLAMYQVQNVMSAVAALRAYGLGAAEILESLKGFVGSTCNPGRFNLYKVQSGGHVIIDYGHNPGAFSSVAQLVSQLPDFKAIAVLGVPGDRDDKVIEESGRVAAKGFHRVIIKEDYDLRGRRSGEVASLLHQAIKRENPALDCKIVLSEIEALGSEIKRLKGDEILFLFYEKLAPVLNLLSENGAVAVSEIRLSNEVIHKADSRDVKNSKAAHATGK